MTHAASLADKIAFVMKTKIISALALLIALAPLLHSGLVSYGDVAWHLRWMRAFYEGLAQGQWWPIWLSDSDFGLGAPLFGFYAPGSFWLAAILQALGLPVLVAYKCVLGLGMALLIGAGWRANPRFGPLGYADAGSIFRLLVECASGRFRCRLCGAGLAILVR